MKRLILALSACAAASLTAPVAHAVDVCAYTVTGRSGVGCPIRLGDTVCLSVSAAIGPCDAPLQCYGGANFFCLATLTPKSGPQPQCPAASKRPTGFRCFAPVRPPATSTPIETATFTPTGTPLPETPTATGTPEATSTDTPVVEPTFTATAEATATETPTGVPTGTSTATVTPTETETEEVATATATATEEPTGTPTGTAAALAILRFR